MSPVLTGAAPLDAVLVLLFLVVTGGALVAVGLARVRGDTRSSLEDREVPPTPIDPRREQPAEAPSSADPAVELERVAIRRLRLVDGPARSWTDDVGVIEAWWVLGSAAPVPPGRDALARFVHLARLGEVALAELDGSVAVQVEAVLAHRHPRQVWAWEDALGVVPGRPLLRALARVDGDLARDALARHRDPRTLLGELVCVGLDAGRVDEALQSAWIAGEADAWARNDRPWLERELLRLVRVDRGAAERLHATLVEAAPLPPDILLDYLRRLQAGRSPEREGIAGEGPPVEQAARVLAAIDGGADVRMEVPRVRALLAEAGAGVAALFALVLQIDLARGDADGIGETLTLAGPEGWQVAAATWESLRLVHPSRRPSLLAALRRPCARGPVAREAGEPPPWFAALQPRPTELLSIFAAIGAEGPWWFGAPDPRG